MVNHGLSLRRVIPAPDKDTAEAGQRRISKWIFVQKSFGAQYTVRTHQTLNESWFVIVELTITEEGDDLLNAVVKVVKYLNKAKEKINEGK